MASKSERTIVEALGVPEDGDVTKLDFSGTTASGVLDANSTFRFAATEDCHFKLTTQFQADPTSSDTILFAGIPEVFQTDENATTLMVVQSSTSGSLYVTRMKTPKK